jgi:hypothetical protein
MQPDATRRTLIIAPGVVFPDPFRSHDLIVSLV